MVDKDSTEHGCHCVSETFCLALRAGLLKVSDRHWCIFRAHIVTWKMTQPSAETMTYSRPPCDEFIIIKHTHAQKYECMTDSTQQMLCCTTNKNLVEPKCLQRYLSHFRLLNDDISACPLCVRARVIYCTYSGHLLRYPWEELFSFGFENCFSS